MLSREQSGKKSIMEVASSLSSFKIPDTAYDLGLSFPDGKMLDWDPKSNTALSMNVVTSIQVKLFNVNGK